MHRRQFRHPRQGQSPRTDRTQGLHDAGVLPQAHGGTEEGAAEARLKYALFLFEIQIADQSPVKIGLTPKMSVEVGAASGIWIERLRGELGFDLRRQQRGA